ncbi:hypothetical protein G3260_006758 [Streptomyces albus]|uniref:hypothetical protein n=1 Tax=Streptomyces albus TaxID=1888 RepID=UPI0013B499E8|nr:hypothetical protein [Streptomyces albus]QID39809.1 hypothetical protein G3260_006758 [Streptomyces albus]
MACSSTVLPALRGPSMMMPTRPWVRWRLARICWWTTGSARLIAGVRTIRI